MTSLIALSLICPALIAIAISVWVPSELSLGRPFWTLMIFLITLPLLPLSAWLLLVWLFPDPYGYGAIGLIPMAFFGLLAIGWLLGVAIVVFVRSARGRKKVSL
jgi:hypothetical protein